MSYADLSSVVVSYFVVVVVVLLQVPDLKFYAEYIIALVSSQHMFMFRMFSTDRSYMTNSTMEASSSRSISSGARSKAKVIRRMKVAALQIVTAHAFRFPDSPPEHLRGSVPPEFFGEKPRGPDVCWTGIFDKINCCNTSEHGPNGWDACWDEQLHTYEYCCQEKVVAPNTPEEVLD